VDSLRDGQQSRLSNVTVNLNLSTLVDYLTVFTETSNLNIFLPDAVNRACIDKGFNCWLFAFPTFGLLAFFLNYFIDCRFSLSVTDF